MNLIGKSVLSLFLGAIMLTYTIYCLHFVNSNLDKCADVIAAEGNNGFCGVGLAYKARIGGKKTLLYFLKKCNF